MTTYFVPVVVLLAIITISSTSKILNPIQDTIGSMLEFENEMSSIENRSATNEFRSVANATKPVVNTATNQISERPIPNGTTDITDSTPTHGPTDTPTSPPTGTPTSSPTAPPNHSMEPATKTERPLLILHVGPGKTGTTSVQNTLENETKALESDQCTYIGNNEGPLDKTKSYHCENHEPRKGCTRVLGDEMMDLLKTYSKSYNHTLFGSNEFLYDMKDHRIMAWVNATQNLYQWNVQVVVSYRRLHEYLPSFYNQHYKKNRISTESQTYGHHNWPGIDGNYKLPTFPEYLENRVNHEVDLIKHDTVSTYEAWRKYFNVSIFNVHQEGDLTTNFVCEILKTETLCNELTRRFVAKNEGTRSNTATIVFDYDIMGVTAWEKGLIHPFLDSRNPLREDIKKHHQKQLNSTKLPMVCPNATILERLRESSWKHEKWAEPFTEKPVSSFDESWEHMLPKFCSVDAEAALQLPEWKTFFEERYENKERIYKSQQNETQQEAS